MRKLKPGTRVRVSFGKCGEHEFMARVVSDLTVVWDDEGQGEALFDLARWDAKGRIEVIDEA